MTRGVARTERRPGGTEGFNLYFLLDDGRALAVECLESLEIALDQSRAIAGIRHDEWRACQVEVRSEDGSFRRSDVV